MAALGFCFTVFALLSIPLTLFISAMVMSDIENYDADAILRNGNPVTARIISMEPMTNVSVNGEHPTIFRYTYEARGKTITDAFQTFDDNRMDYKVGDTVPARYYNGQSILTGMERFVFPFYLFGLMPLPFLIIGLVFMWLFFRPVWREYQLYKSGKVIEGTVVSLVPNGSYRGSRQTVTVHYVYVGRDGNKVFGQSTTSDFGVMHEKKPGDAIKLFASDDYETSAIVPRIENQKYRWGIQW